MKQHLRIAILMTLVTTVLFGLLYPLAVTGLGQLFFPAQANGGMITQHGQIVGSRLIGQPFSSDWYFHPRPSGAGNGYDPVAPSGGASNLGPTNRQLIDRVKGDVEKLHAENPGAAIPWISLPLQDLAWTRKSLQPPPSFRFLASRASAT